MRYSFAGSKAQGEWAEVCFVAECLRRGLAVAKPYGDSLPYDLIIGSRRGPLLRVQVKSVSVRHPLDGIYHVATMRSVAHRASQWMPLMGTYLGWE